MLKKACLLGGLSALLAFTYIQSATVAERGGGSRATDIHAGEQIQHDRNYGNYGYEGGYGGYGYEGGAPVVAPMYGGYLVPGPVDPGQDEADAIYRANQHPE